MTFVTLSEVKKEIYTFHEWRRGNIQDKKLNFSLLYIYKVKSIVLNVARYRGLRVYYRQ